MDVKICIIIFNPKNCSNHEILIKRGKTIGFKILGMYKKNILITQVLYLVD